MSDLHEWLKERRSIHDATPRGVWELSSAERDAFYNLPALVTAVEKVLELHKPEFFSTKYERGKEVGELHVCMECEMYAPCPTACAIEGAIKDGQ